MPSDLRASDQPGPRTIESKTYEGPPARSSKVGASFDTTFLLENVDHAPWRRIRSVDRFAAVDPRILAVQIGMIEHRPQRSLPSHKADGGIERSDYLQIMYLNQNQPDQPSTAPTAAPAKTHGASNT
jgi:hypothetical protein